MSSAVYLVLGACVMVGTIAAAYCAMLAFHDPFRPKWLNVPWADEAVIALLITVGTIDFGLVLRELHANGIDPLVGIIFEIAFILAAAALLWKKLHMAERVDAAHHGMSPFSQMRHIRHRQRGGFGTGGAVGMA